MADINSSPYQMTSRSGFYPSGISWQPRGHQHPLLLRKEALWSLDLHLKRPPYWPKMALKTWVFKILTMWNILAWCRVFYTLLDIEANCKQFTMIRTLMRYQINVCPHGIQCEIYWLEKKKNRENRLQYTILEFNTTFLCCLQQQWIYDFSSNQNACCR